MTPKDVRKAVNQGQTKRDLLKRFDLTAESFDVALSAFFQGEDLGEIRRGLKKNAEAAKKRKTRLKRKPAEPALSEVELKTKELGELQQKAIACTSQIKNWHKERADIKTQCAEKEARIAELIKEYEAIGSDVEKLQKRDEELCEKLNAENQVHNDLLGRIDILEAEIEALTKVCVTVKADGTFEPEVDCEGWLAVRDKLFEDQSCAYITVQQLLTLAKIGAATKNSKKEIKWTFEDEAISQMAKIAFSAAK